MVDSSDYHPRVFISYTHETEEHIKRVLELANKLRESGIDTILDQYEDCPPEGWPHWMDRNIKNSDFVLMICTETYYLRVMGEESAGKGLGVKWEGRLIYQHYYDNGGKSNKFIPIIFDEMDEAHIPTPFKGNTHYNLGEEGKYDKLYWFLRGIKNIEKPRLGKLKPLPEKERRSLFVGGFINPELWDEAKWLATAFVFNGAIKEPPTLAIIFEKEEPARKIIEGWINRLGDIDEYNELRISIIEGDFSEHDKGYSIHINANVSNIVKRSKAEGWNIPEDIFVIIGRINRMNPSENSKNLELFKQFYKVFGSYFVKVGFIKEGSIQIIEEPYLHKREIEFRKLEDINKKNDIDSVILK